MCVLLYDDRIRCFHTLQALDALVDDNNEHAVQMIDAAIRHKQADDELISYQRDKKFLLIHTFTQQRDFYRSQYDELLNLCRQYPDEFMAEVTNVNKSLTRYALWISEGRQKSPEQLQSWLRKVELLKQKKQVMSDLLRR
ncbi:MAG: hypothetical protein RR346_04885 [Bacteroidales bacterium]